METEECGSKKIKLDIQYLDEQFIQHFCIYAAFEVDFGRAKTVDWQI